MPPPPPPQTTYNVMDAQLQHQWFQWVRWYHLLI
jgi:hypothetical protein